MLENILRDIVMIGFIMVATLGFAAACIFLMRVIYSIMSGEFGE